MREPLVKSPCVEQAGPARRGHINWLYVAFFALSPLAALVGAGGYAYHHGIDVAELASLGFMGMSTGLALTAGYHRYFAHRSYECHALVRTFYLLFGAATLQNSALYWASNHRYHHRFVDRPGDPHNVADGLFWAYIGWVLIKEPSPRMFANVDDLKAQPMVMWQHRHCLPIGLTVGFVFPFLIGFAFDRPWGGLLWGGLVRVVVMHHLTFLFNIAGHTVGAQPYSDEDSSRDSWWLAFLMLGEGHHNFHHAFPGDYRAGEAWYQWDPTKWWIWTLSLVGFTSRLNHASAQAIRRRRPARCEPEGRVHPPTTTDREEHLCQRQS